ncbi:MAG: hypothetical protein EOP80_10105 [Variovorax sp.]|nr:MAG: hypothetical protein EOP80_10105 [Variovorax sp.]
MTAIDREISKPFCDDNLYRGHAVKNLSNRIQLLTFSIATLLATFVLVLAGLNERTGVPQEGTSIAHTTKDPR